MTLQELQDENDELREQLRQLKALLVPPVTYPDHWHLTGKETEVMSLLMSRSIMTKELALTVIYGHRSDDPPPGTIIDIYICKMRKKLSCWGIDIKTRWGVGFYIDEVVKQSIREELAELQLIAPLPLAEAAE